MCYPLELSFVILIKNIEINSKTLNWNMSKFDTNFTQVLFELFQYFKSTHFSMFHPFNNSIENMIENKTLYKIIFTIWVKHANTKDVYKQIESLQATEFNSSLGV
jgi:hypothetical protein